MQHARRRAAAAAAATALLLALCATSAPRMAGAQKVWGDPAFAREAEALGLQRGGTYEGEAGTPEPQAPDAADEAADPAAAVPANAVGAAAAGPAAATYDCRMPLEFSATSEAVYAGRIWTSSIELWLRIPANRNSKVKLAGSALAGFKRADGCVRDARRVMMLGDTLDITREDEPLVTVTPWTNPSLASVLGAGVSLEAPANGAPSWTLDTWTASSKLGPYTFTYTASGVKGVLTAPPTPVALAPKMKPVPVPANVEIKEGIVNVHFKGVWDGYPDEGDMVIALAGTTGVATGCTLLPYTEYPDPKANPDAATRAKWPLVPEPPRRRLRLDCTKLGVKLSQVGFEYEDAQCKTCQPNCPCSPGRRIPVYQGKLDLEILGAGAKITADADFIDAVPKA